MHALSIDECIENWKIPNFLNRNRYCIPKVWEWRLIFQRMVGKWECPQGSGETLMMGCLSCIFFLSRSKFFSELIDVFSELIGVFGRINVSWLPLLFWCFQYGGGAKQKEWHFISWLKYAGNVGAALLTKIPRYNHNNVFFFCSEPKSKHQKNCESCPASLHIQLVHIFSMIASQNSTSQS